MNYVDAPSVLLSFLQELADIKSLAMYYTSLQVLSLFYDVSKVKLNSLCKLKTFITKENGISSTLSELLINAKLAQQSVKSHQQVVKLRQEFK